MAASKRKVLNSHTSPAVEPQDTTDSKESKSQTRSMDDDIDISGLGLDFDTESAESLAGTMYLARAQAAKVVEPEEMEVKISVEDFTQLGFSEADYKSWGEARQAGIVTLKKLRAEIKALEEMKLPALPVVESKRQQSAPQTTTPSTELVAFFEAEKAKKLNAAKEIFKAMEDEFIRFCIEFPRDLSLASEQVRHFQDELFKQLQSAIGFFVTDKIKTFKEKHSKKVTTADLTQLNNELKGIATVKDTRGALNFVSNPTFEETFTVETTLPGLLKQLNTLSQSEKNLTESKTSEEAARIFKTLITSKKLVKDQKSSGFTLGLNVTSERNIFQHLMQQATTDKNAFPLFYLDTNFLRHLTSYQAMKASTLTKDHFNSEAKKEVKKRIADAKTIDIEIEKEKERLLAEHLKLVPPQALYNYTLEQETEDFEVVMDMEPFKHAIQDKHAELVRIAEEKARKEAEEKRRQEEEKRAARKQADRADFETTLEFKTSEPLRILQARAQTVDMKAPSADFQKTFALWRAHLDTIEQLKMWADRLAPKIEKLKELKLAEDAKESPSKTLQKAYQDASRFYEVHAKLTFLFTTATKAMDDLIALEKELSAAETRTADAKRAAREPAAIKIDLAKKMAEITASFTNIPGDIKTHQAADIKFDPAQLPAIESMLGHCEDIIFPERECLKDFYFFLRKNKHKIAEYKDGPDFYNQIMAVIEDQNERPIPVRVMQNNAEYQKLIAQVISIMNQHDTLIAEIEKEEGGKLKGRNKLERTEHSPAPYGLSNFRYQMQTFIPEEQKQLILKIGTYLYQALLAYRTNFIKATSNAQLFDQLMQTLYPFSQKTPVHPGEYARALGEALFLLGPYEKVLSAAKLDAASIARTQIEPLKLILIATSARKTVTTMVASEHKVKKDSQREVKDTNGYEKLAKLVYDLFKVNQKEFAGDQTLHGKILAKLEAKSAAPGFIKLDSEMAYKELLIDVLKFLLQQKIDISTNKSKFYYQNRLNPGMFGSLANSDQIAGIIAYALTPLLQSNLREDLLLNAAEQRLIAAINTLAQISKPGTKIWDANPYYQYVDQNKTAIYDRERARKAKEASEAEMLKQAEETAKQKEQEEKQRAEKEKAMLAEKKKTAKALADEAVKEVRDRKLFR
jgi:hypothetical protein